MCGAAPAPLSYYAALLRSRCEFSEQRCLGYLALVQGRAPYECTALSRPIDRSKPRRRMCSTGKSGRVQHAFFAGMPAC